MNLDEPSFFSPVTHRLIHLRVNMKLQMQFWIGQSTMAYKEYTPVAAYVTERPFEAPNVYCTTTTLALREEAKGTWRPSS